MTRNIEDEIAALQSELARFHHDIADAFYGVWRDPKNPDRPKSGRPANKWKGPLGFDLVFGVLDIIGLERVFEHERLLRVWNGGEKFAYGVVADAIRKLQQQDPRFKAFTQRYLERRFQEVIIFWLPWVSWIASIEARLGELEAKEKALTKVIV